MNLRVHELAKELGLPSKELLERLKALKIEAKSHMSTLEEEAASRIRESFKKAAPSAKAPVQETPLKEARKPAKAGEVPKKAEGVEKPAVTTLEPSAAVVPKSLQVQFPITVKDLSVKLGTKPSELIKGLISRGIFATINQSLEEKVAAELAVQYGFELKPLPTLEESLLAQYEVSDEKTLKPRAPVVTLMGHVDHGKTSLLDAIRQTDVAGGEAGGITQHIGAHEVAVEKGHVIFLDTPGHKAFTAMRARGANVTDIVVLVVASDDGVMPQTEEAIDHARAAGVQIVVALNKCDLPNANLDRVKKQLVERGLVPEDWGGKTIMVPVSAKTKQGLPQLLEMLLLEAELLELKADPSKPAKGVVIESKVSKGRGPVATVLIQDGTLRLGEMAVCGTIYGKTRAMIDDRGHAVKEAGPSKAIEILGLNAVPQAGDSLFVVGDEKRAKEITLSRQEAQRATGRSMVRHMTLEEFHSRIQENQLKELRLIVKADVQGSLGALRDEITKLPVKDVQIHLLHTGTGDINESDIMLAAASDAVVIGFHVGQLSEAEALAKEEGVEVKVYTIIYEAVSEIRLAVEGLLEPTTRELFLGRAEVKQVFKITKVGNVAGCLAVKGKLVRAGNPTARIVRNKEMVFEGKLSALKRFKDDVKEVAEGQECGIFIEGFKDFQVGDWIELYQIEKVARKLEV